MCKKCGKIFKAKNYRTNYCSDNCKRIVNNEKAKLRFRKKGKGYNLGKIKGTCKVCNKEFSLRTSNHTLCSLECRKKYHDNIQNFTIIEDNRFQKSLRLRFEILKRDNFTCQYCGRNPKQDKVKLQIDHIIPKSKGGNDNPSNLITACLECNQGKKDIILENRKLHKLNLIKIEVKDEII